MSNKELIEEILVAFVFDGFPAIAADRPYRECIRSFMDVNPSALKILSELDKPDVLRELSLVNAIRSLKAFGTDVQDWILPEWGNAVAGEVGELCNIIKKMQRGDNLDDPKRMLADEMADIIIYIDLMATREGVDLGKAIINKFNEVSDELNCDIKLIDK